MTTLNQKMNTVLTALNERLAERSELLRDMAVALLTGSNLFILGQNGQAKSAAVRLFADCLKDSRFFAYQFNNETDEEKLFGRLDMSSLIPGGVASDVLESDHAYVQMRDALKALYEDYKKVPAHETLLQMSQHRKVLAEMRSVLAALYGSTPSLLTRGKIPESDIVMLDELFKANGGVLHSLLTALNERLYANEGRELKLPTISFFGASNEMPNPYDPEERKYLPLLDRFDLKVKTEYIQDREQRLALLEKKEKDEYDAPLKTQLTMDELGKMQKEVKKIFGAPFHRNWPTSHIPFPWYCSLTSFHAGCCGSIKSGKELRWEKAMSLSASTNPGPCAPTTRMPGQKPSPACL